MVDAFIYMFFVGFGTALGVAMAALISYKVWQKTNNRKPSKKRKGAAY